MKKILIVASLMLGAGGIATSAQAGCLTGAAVGGVAGHVAGGHGVLGAAAGCAIGHHNKVKAKKEQQAPQPAK